MHVQWLSSIKVSAIHCLFSQVPVSYSFFRYRPKGSGTLQPLPLLHNKVYLTPFLWKKSVFMFLGETNLPLLYRCSHILFTWQTQTKLFIGHLLCSTRDPQFPQFLTYHGNHLHYIEVVGVVVREVFREEDCGSFLLSLNRPLHYR